MREGLSCLFHSPRALYRMLQAWLSWPAIFPVFLTLLGVAVKCERKAARISFFCLRLCPRP